MGMMMNITRAIAAGLMSLALVGCKPAEPPADLLKTQREALNKAKAVEGQLQQQADDQRKAIEEAQK